MDIKNLFNQSSLIDLSFFNFRNARTACYFANSEFIVQRINDQFKSYFPILNNVKNIYFPDVLSQLGVKASLIEKYISDIKENGRVLIPEIILQIEDEKKVFSLITTRTLDPDFDVLNGVQGQFIDRTEEWKLRENTKNLLDEQTKNKNTIEKKSDELEDLANQLSKYLSPQVYNNLFSKKSQSSNISRKNLTVFFSDIVKFTDLSDSLEPEQLAIIINSYLSEMASIAINYGGTVDKFIGDAVLIFFGDPETKGSDKDAEQCLDMAIAMKNKISEMQSFFIKSGAGDGLSVRMGITTGYCTVGNFGSEQRMDYTVLGSPVNFAARLQALAPPNEILISEQTYNLVNDYFVCEKFQDFQPKGFSRALPVFKLKDSKRDDKSKKESGEIINNGKYITVNVPNKSQIKDAIIELRDMQVKLEKDLKKKY